MMVYATRIHDFRVEPVKGEYLAGEVVFFKGRLEVDRPFPLPSYYPSGAPIELWADSIRTEFGAFTESGGYFTIKAILPYAGGIYQYRARYPGMGLLEDSCWSKALSLSVTGGGGGGPTPPPTPPPSPSYTKYLPWVLVGGGVLLVLLAGRK
jgi:hypothetical protein